MADRASAKVAGQTVDRHEKPVDRLLSTHTSTHNPAPKTARINIDDRPGEPTALTLTAGDLELSIGLGPAECIAIAGELIQAARRRMGRAVWPSRLSNSLGSDGDGR
jgi:hypothetical protein